MIPEDNCIILFPCTFFHSVLAVRCPSGDFGDSRFIVNGHVSHASDTASTGETTDSLAAAES